MRSPIIVGGWLWLSGIIGLTSILMDIGPPTLQDNPCGEYPLSLQKYEESATVRRSVIYKSKYGSTGILKVANNFRKIVNTS
ncbi:hypothetical protein CEXT_494571 [Caerostris extrusa]|uniref:Uncharacterized protein n=1 Tax=Caerostris extrusa TaxID=172846 RepID=A0AAV4UIM2_CAEEX|nr:hypothetical protein CEXT_494571 [Caerostris extrusa]